MILQALYDYYQRKADDPESGIAPEGFEWKELPFLIVIDREGKFVTLEDTREGEGKKRRARARLVPAAEKRTVGIKANLLWDNVEYALGANPRERKDVADRHADFLRRLKVGLPTREESPEMAALWAFLESSPVERIETSVECAGAWKEILETNAFVTFRIDGEIGTLCDHFRPWIQSRQVVGDEANVCLVTGNKAVTARLHAPIKGIYDGQSSGGAIVSFNLSAFTSFGKSQNHNAPVSESAAFAYTTALATLLGKDSRNKLRVGDATTVFWADRPDVFEEEFPCFFTMAAKDDPDRDALVVRNLYESAFKERGGADSPTRFFVLGLAPNAARISVRFWHTGTVTEFSGKIRQHYDDLEIVRGPKDQGKYSLFWYMVDIATEGKTDNIPPNLAGNLTRAILDGLPYPATLLQQTVR
ncbi:MAG TPA: type I-C CRISPR-associated protein Cas8c/Csd1, partial [Fibrobacteria bacterium]|nr:type I-C CRISPR-associated protein Cas8c/Csd1 [Fibrobacteria bacterium]